MTTRNTHVRARIGTSGWIYPPWRGVFYPKGLVQRRELEYLAERLDTVEINGSFYSLQRAVELPDVGASARPTTSCSRSRAGASSRT